VIKNLFPLFVILCMLSGCFVVPGRASTPTVSTVTYKHLEAKKKEPKEEKKSGVPSEPVIVLLGIGAVLMLMGLSASVYEDGMDDGARYFAVGAGGLGLVFWGAAGIVALTED
jgi:hypothetical protein